MRHIWPIWKQTCFLLLLQVPFMAAVLPDVGSAAPKSKAPASSHAVESKMAYCQTCHGPSGRGFHGYYPIPRLAGQQPEYSINQVKAFAERRRTNNIMFNVAHDLDAGTLTALVKRFSELNPPPLGGPSKTLAPAGKKLYEEGIPDASIPPCAGCHGPEAKGRDQIPRLAGQLPEYVLNKLKNWSKERGQDPKNPDMSAVMEPIAHGLTEKQIREVAAYVSSLK